MWFDAIDLVKLTSEMPFQLSLSQQKMYVCMLAHCKTINTHTTISDVDGLAVQSKIIQLKNYLILRATPYD